MPWLEQETESRVQKMVPAEREKELEKAKEEGLPIVQRQAARGELPVDPIRFQPVRSPGLYEAEFAKRDNDVVFHFWPYGYHEAERLSRAAPRFKNDFEFQLRKVMAESFTAARVVIEHDADMGAWFVKANGWAAQLFWYDLAVKSCEQLHKALGGTEG